MTLIDLVEIATWLWPLAVIALVVVMALQLSRVRSLESRSLPARLAAIAWPSAADASPDDKRRLQKVRVLGIALIGSLLVPLAVLAPLRKLAVSRATEDVRSTSGPPSRSSGSLLSAATLVPEYREGQISGIRVANLVAGSVLEIAGVLEGDLIEAVDDRQLDSPERIASFLAQPPGHSKLQIRSPDGETRVVQLELPGRIERGE